MDLKVIRLLTLLSGIPLCSVAQPFNAYIKFDGFGDALFIDASEVLPTESDFTVEFWFKTCTDTVYIQEAFMGNGDDLEVNFFSNPPDTHHHYDVCALEAYGSPYHCYQNHFLIDSLWHHIAVTYHYSSTDFGFFFDGHGGMVTFDDDFDLEFNGTFYIGRGDRDNWLWNHFDGSMDEVRISNNIRYYSNFSPDTMPFTSDSHTMALWHMNDTAGPQVQDASGNAHHLAIINHPHVLKPISNQMMKSNGRSNVSRSQLQSKCAVPTEGYEIYILSGADTTVSNDSTDQDPSIIEREHGDSKPISIGPNPSEDQMHVYGLGKDVKANYKIRNLQGQAVQCGILDRTDRSIYVSSLPTGIYSIQFESIQGNQLLLFSKQ